MEIAILGTTVRIKGKQATFVVNPEEGKVKSPSDAVLLIGGQKTGDLFQEERGVVFQGAGEYEVKGIKVSGIKAENDTVYSLVVDGIRLFVGTVSGTVKAKEKVFEHDTALIFADEVSTQNLLGMLSPHVLVLTGEKAAESLKSFEKEVQPVNKYVVTKDKLPEETEFVLLA